METKSKKQTHENSVKEVWRKAGRLFTSEQKILIVMEAIRGETSVAEICRKYWIHQTQFYKWNKQFLEAGNYCQHPMSLRTRLNLFKRCGKRILPTIKSLAGAVIT